METGLKNKKNITNFETSNVFYYTYSYNNVVVSQRGFEPPTPGLEGPYSIQLSY